MATDGQPLERIAELLRIAVGPLDLSVKTVLRDAVEKVVAALRYHLCSLAFFLALLLFDTQSRKQNLNTNSNVIKSSRFCR